MALTPRECVTLLLFLLSVYLCLFDLAAILTLSGDIHQNPGPTRFPCTICERAVKTNQRAIQCDECKFWTHCKCSLEEYSVLQELENFCWTCNRCLLSFLPFAECSVLSSACDGPQGLSTPDTCPDTLSYHLFPDCSSSALHIAHINVRSLLSVTDEIKHIMSSESVDMLVLNETWLDSDISDSEVCPEGFKIVRRDRNRRGGGVAVVLADGVRFLTRDDLSTDDTESLWIEVFPGSKRRSMIFCCTYRPPSSMVSSYFVKLSQQIDKCCLTNATQKITLIGDLNCDILNTQSLPTKTLRSFCNQHKLSIVQSLPTRITETTESALDTIITSDNSCFSEVKVTPFCGSDHHIVSCLFHPRGRKERRKSNDIKSRNYKKLTREVVEKLAGMDDIWEDILGFDDFEVCVECFNTFITELQDVFCPTKWLRVSPRRRYPPWYSHPEIQKLRKLRDTAHKNAIRLKSQSSWDMFRSLRNRVTHMLRQAKTRYLADLANCPGDQIKIWKQISYIKGKKIPDPIDPSAATPDNYNDFFSSIPIRLISDLPPASTAPISYLDHLTTTTPFTFEPTSEIDVLNILTTLDTRKATGPDGLIPKFIKQLSLFLCQPISTLINMSFDKTTVPDVWKKANVTPIQR